MRSNIWIGVGAIAALVMSGCGDRRAASPLSPSGLNARVSDSDDVPRTGGTLAPRRADNDGDGYDDGDPPAPPDPGTTPPPDPNQPPNPDQPPSTDVPPTDVLPAPVQLTISVVGTFGTGAFVPNALHAAIGNTIVWMNNDLVPHDIVLDNGTPVGMLAPGQSSLPIPLATETMGYRCTFHPTMVGQVVPAPVETAPPVDPSQPPPGDSTQPPPAGPAPPSPPPADPYGDDGGDGYGDYDYYLKSRT